MKNIKKIKKILIIYVKLFRKYNQKIISLFYEIKINLIINVNKAGPIISAKCNFGDNKIIIYLKIKGEEMIKIGRFENDLFITEKKLFHKFLIILKQY